MSDNREQLIEKEVMIDELHTYKTILENDVNLTRVKAQPAVNRLNECQGRVREVTRSMMALVSELSMYQATALKLEEERESQEEQLANSRKLVASGEPPSADAFRELRRIERSRDQQIHALRSLQEFDPTAQEHEFGKLYYPAKYALRTTAEPRPSAYIPDVGIEIPKPYGGMAPFKPSDCNGSTMRHIRAPIMTDIEYNKPVMQ